MIYMQPITFYAILRHHSEARSEIAEHPDGAMKAYAYRDQATKALATMREEEPRWVVGEILMVPPPQTADAQAANIDRELRAAGVRR